MFRATGDRTAWMVVVVWFLALQERYSWTKGDIFYAHCFLPLLGAFLCAGGAYGVVQLIINAYANGEIGQFYFQVLVKREGLG